MNIENFKISIAEILEVNTIEMSDQLSSFEAWDSLSILSIIAFCHDKYKVTLSSDEIKNSGTVLGLKELIQNKMP